MHLTLLPAKVLPRYTIFQRHRRNPENCVLQRIREAYGSDGTEMLSGIIEDETFLGRRETNQHAHKKLNSGRGTVGR